MKLQYRILPLHAGPCALEAIVNGESVGTYHFASIGEATIYVERTFQTRDLSPRWSTQPLDIVQTQTVEVQS